MRLTIRTGATMALVVGLVAATQAQPPGGRGGFGFGGMGGGPTGLLRSKTVQDAIKVTEEQKEKLTEWAREFNQRSAEMRKEMMADLQGTPREEMMAKFAEISAKVNNEAYKELATVLKEDQVKRLKQIDVQVAGLQAFAMPHVREALKITEEQKEKMQEITMSMGREMRDLMEEYGLGGRGQGGGGFPKIDPAKMQEMQKKQAVITKEAMDKVMAMMTDEQKTTYKELTGEPVDLEKIRSETQGRGGFQRKKKDD